MPVAQLTNLGEIDINKYVASPVHGIFGKQRRLSAHLLHT